MSRLGRSRLRGRCHLLGVSSPRLSFSAWPSFYLQPRYRSFVAVSCRPRLRPSLLSHYQRNTSTEALPTRMGEDLLLEDCGISRRRYTLPSVRKSKSLASVLF